MAGNGALDLSIRIMGKVDPSLARSISQVKGLTGSLTDGLKSTNFLAGTVAKTLGVVGKTGLALGATLTGSVLVGMKQVTNEAAKLEAQMAPVMRYVDGLADASGKASNAMAQNGKTFAQNYADMKNYIQDLSTEIPRTTEQITTMSAALGQSGKDVTEQLQSGILRDTAVAATAMDLDDQTAGDYMAKWEVAFTKRDTEGNKTNYSHDDVMRLMNQINYLGANNATTAAEIASSVNKSASIGQLAGVDPSTTAAIATAMQATGGIAAIIAAFGAMSMAPAAYSAGSTALSAVKNLTIGGKASGAPGGRFGGITVGNLMGLLSPISLFQNTVSGGKGLWSNRENILRSAKMGAWMANSSGQGGIAGRLSSLAGGAIGALNSDALTSGKKKPMQAVAGKIFGATGYINNVANIPTNAVNAMIAAANPAGTATATIGNVLGAGAKAVFGKGGLNLTGGIGAVAGKLGGGFMSLLRTFGPAITSLGTMVAVVSLLGDHFEDVRNIVGQIFGEGGLAVFDAFTGKISGIGDKIKQVFGQLTTTEGLQSIQQKLSGFNIGGLNLGDVFSAAMPAIQTVMPLIQSFAGVFSQIVDLGVNHIKPLLVEVFGFVVNQGIPAVMPLLSTVVSLVGTILVNAIKTVIDVIGKLLPVVEPVVLGIIGLVKGIVSVVVNVANAIIRTLNKINFTVPDWVPGLRGKQFGFNLTEVALPKFADGGFTNGPSLAGEAGTEAIISFRRSQREQNIDTWMQAGKMLGVPIASAMFQGSDFGVAFRRTTELANYAADALEGAAASGNATVQKILDNSAVQQALSLVRRADVAQAQLEWLSNLDNYDLSNVSLFPTAGNPELTRQNLAMMENLQNRKQEVSVPDIGGSGSSGQGESSGGGGYQRSYTSSSGNTYVYAPNFVIYGSMDANDLRSLLDEGYEKFCEYVERYEREKRRTQYGT